MHTRGAWLACLFFLAVNHLGTPAHADQFDDASAYFESGDTERGIELLNHIAETGDAATQYKVGNKLINFDDLGVRWIESAAQRGYASAQADTGIAYATGTGVDQDLARSFMWYYLAVQGDLAPSDRDHALENMKRVYVAMSSSDRQRAEGLINAWKPK